MHSIPWKAFCIVSVSALFAPAGLSLSVIPPTFEQLVDRSDAVVEGRVTAVRSEMAEYQGRPFVYTYVTVSVLDDLKGLAGSEIELRFLGGTVGDFTMQVSGMPRFSAGDHAMFFVEGNGVNFCPLMAATHGHYPITSRATDGASVVLRSNGLPLENLKGVEDSLERIGLAGEEVGDPERAMRLQEFKERIREEVANARTE